MVEILSALPTRPPTPPRVSSRPVSLVQGIHRPENAHMLPGTPEDSPASSQVGLTDSHRDSSSKRVNFSPWTNYIKPPSFAHSNSMSKAPLKPLRPSNECKPSKSILKAPALPQPQSPSDTLPMNDPMNESENIATMWESAAQQLAGESRDSRLDAYMHLFGALKAYDGLMDEQGVPEKIGLVTQFIQRDIRKDGDYEMLDINLITYALKLLTVLVWNPKLAMHLPDEFRIFVIDRATTALQEPKTPKSVVNHYMHLLATQSFQQKIMTGSRATRLLNILQDITDRVNGNGVVAQRLMIYQRLLTQCKSSMATNSTLWVKHLLTGLLHNIKDTRAKAVAFGLQAGTTFGSNTAISNTVRTTLDTTFDDDKKFVTELFEYLMRMVSSREKGVQVPQIWSVVILLLRSKKSPVELWEHFKEWLLVIQKCFNCSDPAIKTQAIIAWNRFVYAVSPSESTGMSMVRMLSKPILSQIERKKIEKLGAQPNSLAFSSYCNLLYYAFRPSASHKQLDTFWKEYVIPPFSTVFNSGPTINDLACKILSEMLWGTQPKFWTENRANETNKLEPEELPLLDFKWVRSRASIILEVFEHLFKTSMWRDDDLPASHIAIAWTSFSKALVEASSKEIKPSTESMQAIASVLGMFQCLWNNGPASLNVGTDDGDDAFFDRFSFLSQTIVSALGPIPFTENLLVRSPSQGTFQTANTPKHRRQAAEKNCRTPILHLLNILSSRPRTIKYRPGYDLLLSRIIVSCSEARHTRGSRLDLYRQFVELHLDHANDPFNLLHHPAECIWKITAGLVEQCLTSAPSNTAKDRKDSLSHGHVNNVVKILEAGVGFTDSCSEWSRLTGVLVDAVRAGKADNAVATTVIEPLADYLLSRNLTKTLSHTGVLLKLAVHPDNGANESHLPPPPKINPRSPNKSRNQQMGYQKLMVLVDKSLSDLYHQFEDIPLPKKSSFLETVDGSLKSCPPDVHSIVLESLQPGLSLWLADKNRRLSLNSILDGRLMNAARSLWLSVPSLIQKSVEHDGPQLGKFEGLVSSGLNSFHKMTANAFIEMWNNTYGTQTHLEYPKEVELALKKLESFVDLQLPSFPRSTDPEEREPTPPEFLSSQEDRGTQIRSFDQHKPVSSPLKLVSSSRVNSLSPASRPSSRAVNLFEPNVVATPKSRRRHDDSQVEFIPVESSPVVRSGRESQFLTEHQRDVKERQRTETANMFPDFKSSSPVSIGKLTPRILSGKSRLSVCNSQETHDEHEFPEDVPMTPTLGATLAENEDEFPVSSPTPTSQNPQGLKIGELTEPSSCPTNEALDVLEQLDPPSSPPDAQSNGADERSASKSVSPLPEAEPDSEEQRLKDASVTEKMSPLKSIIDHPQKAEDEEESESGSDSHEMLEVSLPYSRQVSEELGSVYRNREIPGTITSEEMIPEPTDVPLARSTPDPAHTEAESSEAVDRDGSSKSNSAEGIDMIPDSFINDMDDQVASQLGQDLELSVVLDRKKDENKAPKGGPAPRRQTRKRVHEKEAVAANPENAKRMKTRSSGGVPGIEQDRGRKSKKNRGFKTPRPISVSSSQSKADRHSRTPASTTSKTKRGRSKGIDTLAKTTKTNKRNRSPSVEVNEEDSSMGGPTSKPRASKRKSLRLSGQPVLEVSQNDSTDGRKQKKTRVKSEESGGIESSQMSLVQQQQGEVEGKEIAIQGDDSVLDNETAGADDDADGMEVEVADGGLTDLLPLTVAPQLVSQGTQTEPETGREVAVEASEAGILGSLRRVLGAIRTVTWGRPALREIDDVMFDIRVEAHDANRRHGV